MKQQVLGSTTTAPLSPGIAAEGRTLYVSGQVPVRNSVTVEGGVAEQTRQALENLGSVLPLTAAAPAPAATGDASHSSVADVKRAAIKRPAHTHVRAHGNATNVHAGGSATKGQANGAAGHH